MVSEAGRSEVAAGFRFDCDATVWTLLRKSSNETADPETPRLCDLTGVAGYSPELLELCFWPCAYALDCGVIVFEDSFVLLSDLSRFFNSRKGATAFRVSFSMAT